VGGRAQPEQILGDVRAAFAERPDVVSVKLQRWRPMGDDAQAPLLTVGSSREGLLFGQR
jgi:hypothetical protein